MDACFSTQSTSLTGTCGIYRDTFMKYFASMLPRTPQAIEIPEPLTVEEISANGSTYNQQDCRCGLKQAPLAQECDPGLIARDQAEFFTHIQLERGQEKSCSKLW